MSAVLLTAAIGATTALVPSLPAAAQADAWTPPPDTGLPPIGQLKMDGPEENYELHTECVKAAELEEADRLRQAPWGQLYLRLDEAHRILAAEGKQPGAGQTVTVIDTGVEDGHPYMQGPDGNSRVHGIGEYVKEEGGPGVRDCDGHGTEVAGIIGANTPPDIGFQGVAPHVRINAIRQSSQYYEKSDEPAQPQNPDGGQNGGDGGDGGGQNGGDGGGPGGGDGGGAGGGDGGGPGGDGGAGGDGGGDAGTGESSATGTSQRQADSEEGAGTLATLAAAIIRAADEAPGSVMNVSINNCQPFSTTIDAENKKLQAAVKYAHEVKDVVVVTAAGNVGENCQQNTDSELSKLNSIVSPPVFSDHVLSVAAIGEEGTAPFSMNGPWVGVAAPGTKIISLDPAENSDRIVNQTIDPNGKAAPIEGTSFAAPYVSGLAVLVRQMYPNLTATQVMDRIKYTAHHPATPDGHDQYIGEGVIDPVAALTADVPEEMGVEKIQQQPLPDDLPPANIPNWTPFAVAVTGSAGALVALGVTMFVVHTVRRKQKPSQTSAKASSSGSPD